MRNVNLCFVVLFVMLSLTQAAITVDPDGGQNAVFKTWTISNLTSDPQTVTGINTNSTAGGASSTGVIAGLGLVTGSETFSFTAEAVYGWTTAGADAAVTGGGQALLEYLDGLTAVKIGALAGGSFGPDCKTPGLDLNDDVATFANNTSGTHTPEALILSFDTSGLAGSTTLTLKSFATALWTADDRIDVAVYDASEGTVTKWLKDAKNAFLNAADTVIETGDLVVIGVSTTQGNGKWRIDNLTFEVDSSLSPFSAHSPSPAGPIEIIASSPADVTLTWLAPEDPNIASVDNYDIRVGINEPNLADVAPIDKDLIQSHSLSVSDGSTVYWRVDTTVTVDSKDILDPVTQLIEGSVWSFTVAEQEPAKLFIDEIFSYYADYDEPDDSGFDAGIIKVQDEKYVPGESTATDQIDEFLDIYYATSSGTTLALDIYKPNDETAAQKLPEKLPAMIFIHGGGFTGGNKGQSRPFCAAYAQRGYVAVSPAYRLGLPDWAFEDAEKAILWLRANADTYDIDPDRIAVGGISAGAITALNVGYSEHQGAEVAAIHSHMGSMYGTEYLIDADDPPVFICHGTSDTTVPYSGAVAIVNKIDEIKVNEPDATVDYCFMPLEGLGHGIRYNHYDAAYRIAVQADGSQVTVDEYGNYLPELQLYVYDYDGQVRIKTPADPYDDFGNPLRVEVPDSKGNLAPANLYYENGQPVTYMVENDPTYMAAGATLDSKLWPFLFEKLNLSELRPVIPGDLTGTYGVNLEDLSEFAIHWLTDNPTCDFDSSGTVDMADLQVLSRYWLVFGYGEI